MEVCDNFLGAVNAALNASIATFADLDQDTHLDNITDGGEIVKIAKCIKWYQKSLNYYYYRFAMIILMMNICTLVNMV